MMLIDKYLPLCDRNEIHSIVVHASIQHSYEIVRNFRFTDTGVTRFLFALRGLPHRTVSLQSVLDFGFVLLEEEQDKEFVLGLIGKFWTPTGCLEKFISGEFIGYQRPGFAKAAWNFRFEEISTAETRIITETRIRCSDPRSRRRFSMYWFFIGPFSGIIRREILRSIKRAVQL